MRGLVLTAAILIASCGSPAAAPSSTPLAIATPTLTPTAAPTATPKPKFPHGLYVVMPSLQHPGGTIDVLEASGPLPVKVEFFGNGYDVSEEFIVAGTPQNDGLTLFFADGTQRKVVAHGIFALGRPSLSPDGKFAVVQATQTQPTPDAPMPKFLTDWIVELATGNVHQLIPPGTREFAEGRELPKWFPTGDRILYQTNDFTSGVPSGCDVIRVLDAGTAVTLFTIGANGPSGCFVPMPGTTGPRFHAEPSLDGTRILIPGQMQLYDGKSGQLVADLRAQTLAGLGAAGYKPDTRFPGQGNGGTFPLDGSLSPDNKAITFDGAVEKDGQFGVLLCRINVDGTGFTVLRPPVQVMPMFSNNHNYSQVLPHWR
jgi:hypothetical protein